MSDEIYSLDTMIFLSHAEPLMTTTAEDAIGVTNANDLASRHMRTLRFCLPDRIF